MPLRVQDDNMPPSIGVSFDQSLQAVSIRLLQCKARIFVFVPNKCVVILSLFWCLTQGYTHANQFPTAEPVLQLPQHHLFF